MPIDKLTPKYLSSDSDSKFAAKNTMLDAINLYIGGDDSDSSLNGGDGVLKNVKGNLEVVGSDHLPANSVVLGKVEDTKAKLLYLFVWAPSGTQHSVWVYDPLGRLPDAVENSLRLVYESNQFNFPQDGFVKADIVYSSSREDATREQFDSLGSDFEKDAIIYFTDGVNEPRKINAYRALVSSGSNINGATSENPFPETDFITACLKAPLKPVTFKFDNDSSSTNGTVRSISNFKLSGGFQFAYQHVYRDGGESAISSYSDVAFIPSVLNQGAATYKNHDHYNVCDITIPSPGPEISVVRLLAKQGNAGNFLVVDEIKTENFEPLYRFYNDKILTGVSSDEVNKQFDSLPRKANAQAVSNNRLMYGNYEDGYENIEASCTVKYNYLDRPEDFQDYQIEVKPFKSLLPVEDTFAGVIEGGSPYSPPKQPGVYINTESLPSSMMAGAEVSFSFKIYPENNWHIHGNNAYSQSRRVGPTEPTNNYDTAFDGVNDGIGDVTGVQSPNVAAGANNASANIQDSTQINTREINGVDRFIKASGQGALGSFLGFSWRLASYQNTNQTADELLEGQLSTSLPNNTDFSGEGLKKMTLGCNAGLPFIIKAEPMTFSVQFTLAQDVSSGFQSMAATTIKEMLRTNYGPGAPQFETPENEQLQDLTHYDQLEPDTLQRVREASYDINHQLLGGELISAPFIGEVATGGNNANLNKLISAVTTEEFVYYGGRPYASGVIVNRAKPVFKFRKIREAEGVIDNSIYGNGLKDFTSSSTEFGLSLFLESLSDFDEETGNPIDLEFTTCIRSTRRYVFPQSYQQVSGGYSTPRMDWVTLPQQGVDFDLEDFFEENLGDSPQNIGINSSAGLTLQFEPETDFDPPSYGFANAPWRLQVGQAVIDSNSGFHRDKFLASSSLNSLTPGSMPGATVFSQLTFADGEGGPGGGPSRGDGGNTYDDLNLNSQGSITCTPQKIQNNNDNLIYTWNRGDLFYQNVISVFTVNSAGDSDKIATTLPLLQNPFITDSPSYFDLYPDPKESELNPGQLDPYSVNYKINHGQAEIKTSDFDILFSNDDSKPTFKTSAYHDFGVVYYDERGRHGFVNHLKNIDFPNSSTVYVPGYSGSERGANSGVQGATEIILDLEHNPPSWAHNYKIVYSKNTSVEKFVQYTAGGAFTALPSNVVNNTADNIYVSLNYLQGHPISYVSSFGARTPEGGLNLYKHQEGDKLRVVSYQSSINGDRSYPFAFEFDVVDLVNLGPTENPLSNTPPDKNKQGQFIVLKDNPNASPFDFSSVINTPNNAWGANCVVEIFTPAKDKDLENQVYYETSETYRVVKDVDDNLVHEDSPVTMRNGDVWFRKVAVNFRETENSNYVDLIYEADEEGEASQSNFQSLYLEAENASDLFRSDNVGLGRPNAVLEGATSVRREATVTYSDPSNPESRKLNYSSFNSSLANFKDLPEVYGDINYLNENGSNLFVLQESKSGMIPINKNILSDVSGSQSVIASRQVLGEAIFYPGKNGCDNNPESVADLGEAVFFANKSLGKIYRFDKSKGVQAISDDGMAATLRKAFKEAMDNTASTQHVKIIGGYDPVKDEYLVTILPQIANLTSTGVVLADQPDNDERPTDPDEGDEDDDNDDGPDVPDEEDEDNDDGSEEDNDDETTTFEMVQDAIDYINAQSALEDETKHMTGIQFKALVDNIHQKNGDSGRIIFDSYGDTRDGNTGTADLLAFLAAFGLYYDINQSVYIQPAVDSAARVASLPQVNPFLFKNTQDALDYINSVGTMKVSEFLLLRSFLKNEVCSNAAVGSINVGLPDFLALLAIYGLTSDPDASAYSSVYPGPTASQGSITIEMAIGFIISQGDMTIAQYQVFAEHVKSTCKLDSNEDNVISTVDLLAFLGVYLDEGQSWDLQDSAFNL